jgi:glycosyltransferase involved in cell wall biosynthesis
LKILQQTNQGLGSSRNRLVRESTGELLQYFDADDLLSPDKIEEQVEVLAANQRGMVAVSPYVFFNNDDDPEQGIFQNGWPIIDSDDPLNWLVDLLGPGPTPGQLFGMVPPGAWLTPRTVAETAGPWIEFRSPDDDGEYFARVVLASRGVRRAARGRLYYRKHPGNLSKINAAEMRWGAFRTTDMKAQHILSRTSSAKARENVKRSYMVRAFENYPEFPEITKLCLRRISELGGTDFIPPFGTRAGQLLSRVIGWKAVRTASFFFHRYQNAMQPSKSS